MKVLFIAALMIFSMSAPAKTSETQKVIRVSVTTKGFEPSAIDVKPGEPVVLEVIRTTDETCSREIQIPSKNIKNDLPLNKTVKIELGKLDKGEIRFGCGMNMMDSGKIYVK